MVGARPAIDAGEPRADLAPPAQLAFDKAREIRPNYPSPYYFAGLSRLFDGDVNATILLWEKALSLATPEGEVEATA